MDSNSPYYEILQVAPSASVDEIRQAYVDLVRVWHPDRFASDPRLQKIAEDRMKNITEAYEALSSDQPAPQVTLPPPAVKPAHTAARSQLKPWLIAFGSAALLAVLVVSAAQAVSMFAAPYRAAQLMKTEAARIATLFGPDPAVERSLPPSGKRQPRSRDRKSDPGPRPANGADLTPPRGGKGLGEFHVRNEYDLDCVLRVIERNSPGAAARVIYVQAGQQASIAGLEPGIYRMRVSFGQDWDRDALAFVETDAPEYWIGPFEFFETQNSAERRGLRYNIGLKPPAL